MANRTVTTLTAVLQMNNTKFKKGLSHSEKLLKGFQRQIIGIGASVAAAFSVQQIGRFSKEVFMLSAKAQGVEAAFAKIANSGYMERLKEATHGTVSELELMQRTVVASKFDISLEALPRLLQFATKYAQDTGEQVDILVDKLVRGIGRKSVLILDDLGISATRLKEELGGVSLEASSVAQITEAIGRIADESLAKTGDIIETAAIKTERWAAAWKDVQKGIGDFLRGSTELDQKLRGLSGRLDKIFRPYILGFGEATQQDIIDRVAELASKESPLTQLRDFSKEPLDPKNLFNVVGNFPFEYTLTKMWDMADAMKNLVDIATAPAIEGMPESFDNYMTYMTTGKGWNRWAAAAEPRISTPGPAGQSMEMIASLQGYMDLMDDLFEEWDKEMREDLGKEAVDKLKKIDDQADKLGVTVGVMLVNSFDTLGKSIGNALSGAENGFEELGKTILNNLGNILIMAGLQTGNWPLAILGAAMQLGSGIIGSTNKVDSRHVPRSTGTSSMPVTFRVQGNDLVGVLERNNQKTYMTT